MDVHFKNLISFCENYKPIFHLYCNFLDVQPTMDPESFKRVSRRLCELAETITFLVTCLCYHMALNMGKKTPNNRLFVEYLGGASGNLRKGKEFISLAAEELQSYQEAEEKQDESSKCSYMLQFTLLTQCSG
jgi:hypothetical protein